MWFDDQAIEQLLAGQIWVLHVVEVESDSVPEHVFPPSDGEESMQVLDLVLLFVGDEWNREYLQVPLQLDQAAQLPQLAQYAWSHPAIPSWGGIFKVNFLAEINLITFQIDFSVVGVIHYTLNASFTWKAFRLKEFSCVINHMIFSKMSET